jgi:triacylglycerol esterase/lipase EstA (alpha/beta hydrolase family)
MRRFSPVRISLIALAVTALAVLVIPAASADQPSGARPAAVPALPGPGQFDHGAAMVYSKEHPDSAPPGANDFGCRPSAIHPRPVVLAHGTDASAYADFAGISPRLQAAGYCIFALNYGGKDGGKTYGTEDMWASGIQLRDFVAQVLRATRARQVDLVGYSQGATVARYYVNRLGGAPFVYRWVGVASPTYGGVMYGLVPIASAIPGALDAFAKVTSIAAVEQAQGSDFLTALNAGGDTVPGVRYTTIGSIYDEMIQPFSNIAIRSPAATNIVIQDLCPIDQTGHFNMVYDRFAQQLVVNALDPDTAQAPNCEFVPLGTGIPQVIWAAHS